MFSGIVEELGTIKSFDGQHLAVSCGTVLEDLRVSESIAVNGACLTVIETGPNAFVVETVPETLQRTNLGELAPGTPVNLERAMRYGGRVGGHLVQGHVDGTASVATLTPDGNSTRVGFKASERIMRYVVEKGFIALDGASLTIVERSNDAFSIALIPYTRDHTTFGTRRPGDRVNVEIDITAKYLERLAAPYLNQ